MSGFWMDLPVSHILPAELQSLLYRRGLLRPVLFACLYLSKAEPVRDVILTVRGTSILTRRRSCNKSFISLIFGLIDRDAAPLITLDPSKRLALIGVCCDERISPFSYWDPKAV
jgi:hypothetical protein